MFSCWTTNIPPVQGEDQASMVGRLHEDTGKELNCCPDLQQTGVQLVCLWYFKRLKQNYCFIKKQKKGRTSLFKLSLYPLVWCFNIRQAEHRQCRKTMSFHPEACLQDFCGWSPMFSTFNIPVGLPSFIVIEFQGLTSCLSSYVCCQAAGSNTHSFAALHVLHCQKHIPFFGAVNLVVVPCIVAAKKAVT